MFLLNCVKLIYNQGKVDLFSTILRHYVIKVYLSLSLSLLHVSEVLNIMICSKHHISHNSWK